MDLLRDRALAQEIIDALNLTETCPSYCSALRSIGFALRCIRRKSAPNVKKSGPWVVLVAGEHWKVTSGERWLGQHCSLGHIAKAYDQITGAIPLFLLY